MIGIQTDGTKDKILREDPGKLAEEAAAKARELGLAGMIPRRGQDPYTQMKDMRDEAGHINDLMSAEHERNVRKRAEEREAARKTPRERRRMVESYVERREKEAFASRRIFFTGGGFEDYLGRLEMMPERVLLRRIERGDEIGGIALPETYDGDVPSYAVACVCPEADGVVSVGDVVMVEKYSGTEIVSGAARYLVSFVDDIVCVVG